MRTLLARAALVAATASLPLAVAVPAASAHDPGHSGRYRTVAYFTQWGIYGRNYLPRDIGSSAGRLDVIDYAFGNVSADGRCFEANAPGQGDAWADYQRPFSAAESVDGMADAPGQALNGNFNQLRKLKAAHPGLRAQMSLGGWSWSKYFSDAALTPASRRAFVASCLDLFLRGDLPVLDGVTGGKGAAAGVFDGIDIDWEWPASAGNDGNVVRPEDRQNFPLLLAEFRRQLDTLGRARHRHYTLSAFLPAAPAKVDAGVDVRKVFAPLDWATLQGYDLHGTWETATNHQSSLYAPPGDPSPEKFSVDLAVRTYLRAGAPRHKVLLGVPFYGHGWTGVSAGPHQDGLFQASTGAAPSAFDPGTEDYKRLAALPGFTVHRDRADGVAWLYDGTTFWNFDDPIAIGEKMAYVRRLGLGGAMAWSLDGDNGSLVAAMDRGLR
jgi:chitinase